MTFRPILNYIMGHNSIIIIMLYKISRDT